MMERLQRRSIQQWFSEFVDALREAGGDREKVLPATEPPILWPLRSANSNTRAVT
jgi:trehalose 6-phosphate synthase